jgi:chorismate mutase
MIRSAEKPVRVRSREQEVIARRGHDVSAMRGHLDPARTPQPIESLLQAVGREKKISSFHGL